MTIGSDQYLILYELSSSKQLKFEPKKRIDLLESYDNISAFKPDPNILAVYSRDSFAIIQMRDPKQPVFSIEAPEVDNIIGVEFSTFQPIVFVLY